MSGEFEIAKSWKGGKTHLKCKQIWKIESAKQSRCSTLWEKTREKKVFQKVESLGNQISRYFNFEPSFNSDSVVLEIYFDHKLQWPQERLNCKSLEYKVVTYPLCRLTSYWFVYLLCVQGIRSSSLPVLWPLEFEIQINLEHDTIAN